MSVIVAWIVPGGWRQQSAQVELGCGLLIAAGTNLLKLSIKSALKMAHDLGSTGTLVLG